MRIKDGLSRYMGTVWEQICLDWMLSWQTMNDSPFIYEEVGRWWGGSARTMKQVEVDILAWDKENAIIGECKWWGDKIGMDVYKSVLSKAQEINRKRKYIYLFSKSGFSDELSALASVSDDLRLFTLDDILGISL